MLFHFRNQIFFCISVYIEEYLLCRHFLALHFATIGKEQDAYDIGTLRSVKVAFVNIGFLYAHVLVGIDGHDSRIGSRHGSIKGRCSLSV
ncbi:hypothetical protein Bache_0573 [Bacteroides helcogenes P 36-108]|uniref:Uncharacterized protein n=1 Tax=Bacteroides helcogenes (strain ATCC 35417 / DSM 20613 / JCM 6297 / CCUG 15421 / P 36-108) TaxID=693979 RepID=E6SWK0_BACT6|nr:hypothetical protein Bache_0573 [Bacteroides helcogenes P 36-108]